MVSKLQPVTILSYMNWTKLNKTLFINKKGIHKGFLFLYQNLQRKKIRSVNTILSLAQGVNKRNNHHIFIIHNYLLILNIKTIVAKYIYIEKFIEKRAINDSKLQCKLLSISLH